MGVLIFFLNVVLNLILIFVVILIAGIGIYAGMYFGERLTYWLAKRKRKKDEELHGPSGTVVRFT
jgi:hypothetical protein